MPCSTRTTGCVILMFKALLTWKYIPTYPDSPAEVLFPTVDFDPKPVGNVMPTIDGTRIIESLSLSRI